MVARGQISNFYWSSDISTENTQYQNINDVWFLFFRSPRSKFWWQSFSFFTQWLSGTIESLWWLLPKFHHFLLCEICNFSTNLQQILSAMHFMWNMTKPDRVYTFLGSNNMKDTFLGVVLSLWGQCVDAVVKRYKIDYWFSSYDSSTEQTVLSLLSGPDFRFRQTWSFIKKHVSCQALRMLCNKAASF